MSSYLKNQLTSRSVTPQSEPIPGKEALMSKNNQGGYSFNVSPIDHVKRFLILGGEGGSYYHKEKSFNKQNVEAVSKAIAYDGKAVVQAVKDISFGGKASKNGPALFVLAMCMSEGDLATKTAAKEALPSVARTGTHLFEYVDYADKMRGWGKGLRKAVNGWYDGMKANSLAYQAIKYKQRG